MNSYTMVLKYGSFGQIKYCNISILGYQYQYTCILEYVHVYVHGVLE